VKSDSLHFIYGCSWLDVVTISRWHCIDGVLSSSLAVSLHYHYTYSTPAYIQQSYTPSLSYPTSSDLLDNVMCIANSTQTRILPPKAHLLRVHLLGTLSQCRLYRCEPVLLCRDRHIHSSVQRFRLTRARSELITNNLFRLTTIQWNRLNYPQRKIQNSQ
jgi:hypothetical protein